MSYLENWLQNEPSKDPRLAAPTSSLLTPPSVKQARAELHGHLHACRQLLVADELVRLRRTRLGRQTWVSAWDFLYRDDYAAPMIARVDRAITYINGLFFSTLVYLVELTLEIDRRAEVAPSLEKIDDLIDELSERGWAFCTQRCVYACWALAFFQGDVTHTMPIVITDASFRAMVHEILGLNESGNYLPEDKNEKKRGGLLEFNFWNVMVQTDRTLTEQGFTENAAFFFMNVMPYLSSLSAQNTEVEEQVDRLDRTITSLA